ncbi:aldehyde dehydrogenase [Streptomyces brasiliensis]|nr:aldehyde dehydrogenase [Streptomyces brasiliensis]
MTTTTPRLKSYDKLFIGGKWVEPSSDKKIQVISPSTEELIATVPEAREADVDAAVAAARKAFDEGPWPRMSPAERATILARVGEEVGKRLEDMITAFTEEIGAPTGLSRGFLGFATQNWQDGATLHERFSFEEERTWDGGHGKIVREPVGVVATIIPWNGPVGTASLKIAPALAAGCTVVLKPAPEGPIGTNLLAEALEAAGLPEGVISVLPAGREVGEYLVRHPDVDKVTFTGSTAAGRRVMALCADRIARVTLELGGKSAGIIADDIPLEDVMPSLGFAGILNSGQVCAAITRILVPRERQDELLAALKASFAQVKVGDPHDPETMLGPLVSERQRDRVEEYIRLGREEGARVVFGGGRPEERDKGWYIEPTIFADVSNNMRIAQEEIFGPVVCVIPFDTIDEAVRIANDSMYGLSGAVYAKNEKLAEGIARRIRTGQISINSWGMCVVQPFGGFKQSGLGREGGVEGLEPFLETKLIQYA